MEPLHCAYCSRYKRPDQLMETHSHKLICVLCAEEFNMCEVCGSTTKENFSAAGQIHYEPTCIP